MRRFAFVPAVLVAAVLVGAKLALIWPLGSIQALKDLVAISAEDVFVAICFGTLAGVALRLANGRRRLARMIWVAILVCGVMTIAYAILGVGIFRAMREPLNARMLALVSRLSNFSSSIEAHCSWWVIGCTIALPVIFVLVSNRLGRIAWRGGMKMAVIALAMAWFLTGLALLSHSEPDSWQRRAGRNPHAYLIASVATQLLSDDDLELGSDFPPAYLDDLKPASQYRVDPLTNLAPAPRNVIVVVLESTSAQYLSLYGSRFDTTPNLLAESAHAVVFDRFYSHIGYTFCAMMPLTFSVYPGLPGRYVPFKGFHLPIGMPELLKTRGYRTAWFSAADPEWEGMGEMAKRAGMDQVIGPDELHGPASSSWGTEDGVMIDGLIQWVQANRSKPFYAVAWTDQSHHPYTLAHDTQPTEFLDETSVPQGELLERYLNTLRQADRHLGRLFQALRASGLSDDTLVVITGDHGEAFGSPHDVMGHGAALFDENLRVPLMFWNPRLFPSAQRIAKPGGHVDLNPTLLHLLGITPPSGWQGVSLFSPDHPGRVYMMADRSGYLFGMTDGRFKYIHHLSGGFERLYDLFEDPQEQRDVSLEHSALRTEMRARVSAFLHAEDAYLKAAR